MTEIPRRLNLAAFSPAERAIYDAVQAVEAMAADVRLTDAVILLQAARDSVADYIDNIWPSRRYVSALPASASTHPHGEAIEPDVIELRRCNRCGRLEYALEGSWDRMTQPDSRECGGQFVKPPSALSASLDETQQP